MTKGNSKDNAIVINALDSIAGVTEEHQYIDQLLSTLDTENKWDLRDIDFSFNFIFAKYFINALSVVVIRTILDINPKPIRKGIVMNASR